MAKCFEQGIHHPPNTGTPSNNLLGALEPAKGPLLQHIPDKGSFRLQGARNWTKLHRLTSIIHQVVLTMHCVCFFSYPVSHTCQFLGGQATCSAFKSAKSTGDPWEPQGCRVLYLLSPVFSKDLCGGKERRECFTEEEKA